MISRVIGFAQRAVSRFPAGVEAARLLRNQAAAVLGSHLADGRDQRSNGEALLVKACLFPGSSWVDVGANRGEWSRLCVDHVGGNGTAILIEPAPRHQQSLQELGRRVRSSWIVQAAAGSTPGTGMLYEEPGFGEMSSLVPDPVTTSRDSVSVQITTIDREVDAAGVDRIDLLKTDCEGYDLHALQGARRLLETGNVSVVQFEYNSQWAYAGNTLAAALRMFEELEYKTYLLKGTGLWHFPYPRYGEFFSYANFVAISRHASHTLQGLVRGVI